MTGQPDLGVTNSSHPTYVVSRGRMNCICVKLEYGHWNKTECLETDKGQSLGKSPKNGLDDLFVVLFWTQVLYFTWLYLNEYLSLDPRSFMNQQPLASSLYLDASHGLYQ